MKLLTVFAFLAVTVAAMPTGTEQGDMDVVAKRASCAVEFPQGCANICCKQNGGCSFLNCADSYCHMFNIGQPECICKCHYG
ncbi:hypothetical protein C8A00DRAFT_37356 [Chaetomidium leptoderma]|uniref:Uncharacterized protein n=1 Tax=Chaetomidium leptoderma TaxID=669021 RepID=A0AAN6ZSB9_9PEZI|nr:hypothetical protein C8A00DRAFT_37356 [Chaetomidium leptoderma]